MFNFQELQKEIPFSSLATLQLSNQCNYPTVVFLTMEAWIQVFGARACIPLAALHSISPLSPPTLCLQIQMHQVLLGLLRRQREHETGEWLLQQRWSWFQLDPFWLRGARCPLLFKKAPVSFSRFLRSSRQESEQWTPSKACPSRKYHQRHDQLSWHALPRRDSKD